LRKIEEDLRQLEKQYSTNTLTSLNQEKKFVSELGKLQAAKKLFQEYKTMREAIKADDAAIKELESELDKSKGTSDDAKSQTGALREKRDATGSTITQAKDEEAEINGQRDEIRKQIALLQDQLVTEKVNLDEYRNKKREQQREIYAAERDKRKAEFEKERQRKAELYEKRKERDNERKKLELLEVPYQDELDLCDQLEKYMETFLPKKESAPAPTPAAPSLTSSNFADAPEGTFIKKDDSPAAVKKKGKKQKAVKVSQDMKHNVEVFLQFERLSLAPPSKISDVETTISEIQARKAHYSKLSASKIQERAEAAEAAKAENGRDKEKEQEKENTTTTSKSITEDDVEQQDDGVAPEEEIIQEVVEV